MSSPQRLLNKEYGFNFNEMYFIGDLKIQDLTCLVDLTAQICSKCKLKKKTHYCVQPHCSNKELICWKCEPNSIGSRHYMHEFTYVLPLFCKNIFDNFLDLKQNIANFYQHLQGEIEKIKKYLLKMEEIAVKTNLHIQRLNEKYAQSNFDNFKQNVEHFSEQLRETGEFSCKLSTLLNNTKFYSPQECHIEEQHIVSDLLEEVNNLKWLNDPQKNFKQLLQLKSEESKKDLFLSSRKKIQFTQIDNFYKANNEFFTENLKTHRIELKVESDFLNKTKLYEALIYHLREVQSLSIENANMNQIRTPLTFRKLREFQFNCNTETEPFNLRLQNITDQLRSLTLRKIREEQIKNLKTITQNSPNLNRLHFQFYNKCDLSNSKELCELLGVCENMRIHDFYLKIRTESEVKRMYGYLSKFYKETGEASNCFLIMLKQFIKKQSFCHITIEGVKGLGVLQILESLEEMPQLLTFRIYYDNIDLLTQLNLERVKLLEKKCEKKMRVVYALAKNSKFKHLSNRVFNEIAHNFLI